MTQTHPNAADLAAAKRLARDIVAVCERADVHPAIAVGALTEVITAILVMQTLHPAAALEGAAALNRRIVGAITKAAAGKAHDDARRQP